MPAGKVRMSLLNTNNNNAPRLNPPANPNANIKQNGKPLSLYGSMISRIHNTKPGCGSCGRH